VNNNLQVISSLLNLRAGRLADPAARHMFEASQSSRIRSMALDLRLVKVLMWARQLDGKLLAPRPGGPKFEIVFPREARRK
jgi:two-component sensor histidine kinase